MRNFAEWVCARRYRAALMVVTFGAAPLLGLLGTPLVLWSIAVLSLVALRKGLAEGLIVASMAALALALGGPLTKGYTLATLPAAVGLWVPVLALSALLRRSGSLALTIQTLVLAVALLVALLFVAAAPVAYWYDLLQAMEPALRQMGVVIETDAQRTAVASALTGMVAAGMTLSVSIGLLLGRWWESLLVRPGAFGREFRALKMGKVLTGLAGVVFAAALLTRSVLIANVAAVLVVAFALQGLAVAHFVVALRSLHNAWIGVMYVALALLSPYALMLIATLGFVDNWFDLRERWAQ